MNFQYKIYAFIHLLNILLVVVYMYMAYICMYVCLCLLCMYVSSTKTHNKAMHLAIYILQANVQDMFSVIYIIYIQDIYIYCSICAVVSMTM